MKVIQLYYTPKKKKITQKTLPEGFIEKDSPWFKEAGIEYEECEGRYTNNFTAWIYTLPKNKKNAMKLLRAAVREEKTKQDKILLVFSEVGTLKMIEFDSHRHELKHIHKEKLMKPNVWLGTKYVGHIFCKPEDKQKAVEFLTEKCKTYMATNPTPRVFV